MYVYTGVIEQLVEHSKTLRSSYRCKASKMLITYPKPSACWTAWTLLQSAIKVKMSFNNNDNLLKNPDHKVFMGIACYFVHINRPPY
jgi:hypothetical protein